VARGQSAGISSSDDEHTAAIQRAQTIAQDMFTEWEWPLLADSGNGAHLFYRIDLIGPGPKTGSKGGRPLKGETRREDIAEAEYREIELEANGWWRTPSGRRKF
jgi:hypothetical protein